jgi:hypothetical protein
MALFHNIFILRNQIFTKGEGGKDGSVFGVFFQMLKQNLKNKR